jgi:hypothetical protein
MPIIATGKADQNRTVEELMKDMARSGNRYLDLATGEFFIMPEAGKREEPEKKPEEDVPAKPQKKKK